MLLLVSVVRFVVNFVAKVCNKPFFVKPKVFKQIGNSLNKVSVALILYFIKAQAVEICRKVEFDTAIYLRFLITFVQRNT